MKFRVGDDFAILRAKQSETSKAKRSLEPRQDLGECPVSEDGKWLTVDVGPLQADKGFVLKASCVESVDGDRPPVERAGVVQKCVFAEVTFNDSVTIRPFFVLADFLLARAIIETDVTNAGLLVPGSDGVGPMQVSTKEWKSFTQNGGALAVDAEDSDRDHPIFQIPAAAFRMHSDRKALSQLRTPPGSTDPFVPQLLDILFAYLTDSPAAALAIRDAHATSANHNLPFTKFLRDTLSDAEVTALHQARGDKFFGKEAPKSDGASPEADKTKGQKSLNDVVTEIESLLDKTLNQAFDDIKEFIPEAVPLVSVPESSGGGTTFTEKAPGIMRDLIRDFEFTDFQAAGILGNMGRETGGFTLFQERHPRVPPGGFGWCQWTGDRRVLFEKFCSDNNLVRESDKANYGFLKLELETSKKSVVPHLKSTATLEKATEIFELEFEVAGVVAMDDRIMWARRALGAFRGAGTPGTQANSLQQLISDGRITFDSPILREQLLGLNTGTKVTPKLQALVLRLCDLTPHIQISSLVRSGGGSFHNIGRAVDIGNQEIAGALLPQIATQQMVTELRIDELIFDARIINPHNDPNKFNFNEGHPHPFSPGTISDHGNHIHFAVTA
ncbi:phage tail tip lysozyme [Bradyrhizobium sp. WSM1417]|uniref:phage tail tip lysozyme n=1 Tax=Bradyrhizobium sp. WSM1417 TaxID=754500 RepID=UPI0004B04E89|nr:phage tail tip lysozyme [Bradyrhizobium sp. WSM1417]